MGFLKIKFDATREDTLKMISDNERVNKNVRFDDESLGRPFMHVKEKNNGVHITCELIGGNRRDNGFLVGTFFTGKLREKDGVTTLSGWLMTAPIYHLIMLALFVVFVIQCFKVGGLSVVPIFIVVFDIILFKNEFKKRGFIKRYLHRAARRMSPQNEK